MRIWVGYSGGPGPRASTCVLEGRVELYIASRVLVAEGERQLEAVSYLLSSRAPQNLVWLKITLGLHSLLIHHLGWVRKRGGCVLGKVLAAPIILCGPTLR